MVSLENKAGEIKAGTCLLSFAEIVNNIQQIGCGALLIVNSYVLGFLRK